MVSVVKRRRMLFDLSTVVGWDQISGMMLVMAMAVNQMSIWFPWLPLGSINRSRPYAEAFILQHSMR